MEPAHLSILLRIACKDGSDEKDENKEESTTYHYAERVVVNGDIGNEFATIVDVTIAKVGEVFLDDLILSIHLRLIPCLHSFVVLGEGCKSCTSTLHFFFSTEGNGAIGEVISTIKQVVDAGYIAIGGVGGHKR